MIEMHAFDLLVFAIVAFMLGVVTMIVIACGCAQGIFDSQREPHDGSLFDYKYNMERRLTDGNEVKKPKDH